MGRGGCGWRLGHASLKSSGDMVGTSISLALGKHGNHRQHLCYPGEEASRDLSQKAGRSCTKLNIDEAQAQQLHLTSRVDWPKTANKLVVYHYNCPNQKSD